MAELLTTLARGGFALGVADDRQPVQWRYVGDDGREEKGWVKGRSSLSAVVVGAQAMVNTLSSNVEVEVGWQVQSALRRAGVGNKMVSEKDSETARDLVTSGRLVVLHKADEELVPLRRLAQDRADFAAWERVLSTPRPRLGPGPIKVACDGSYDAVAKVGTWCWYSPTGAFDAGVMHNVSSSYMELAAIEHAVMAMEEGCELSILSDCVGVIYALGFDKYGKAKRVRTSRVNEAEAQLRDEVRSVIRERGVNLRWIKGHGAHGVHRQADIRARGLLRATVGHERELV